MNASVLVSNTTLPEAGAATSPRSGMSRDFTKSLAYASIDLSAKVLAAIATVTLGIIGIWWQAQRSRDEAEVRSNSAVLTYLSDQIRLVEVCSTALSDLRKPDPNQMERAAVFLSEQLQPSQYVFASGDWMDSPKSPRAHPQAEGHHWLTASFAKHEQSLGLVPDEAARMVTVNQAHAVRVIATIWEARRRLGVDCGAVLLGDLDGSPAVLHLYETASEAGVVSPPDVTWKSLLRVQWGLPPQCQSVANLLVQPTLPATTKIDGSATSPHVSTMYEVRRLTNLRDSAAEHVTEALIAFPHLGKEFLEVRAAVRKDVNSAWSEALAAVPNSPAAAKKEGHASAPN